MKKKLLIFASGTKTGGGSGFEMLCRAVMEGKVCHIEIVGVVSNHANGGVREKAERYGIPFYHFSDENTAEAYQALVKQTGAEFVALSGWLLLAKGLDPRTTFNIHPGSLPQFGGKGMYGHHVHKKVMEAFERGEVTHSAVTMHFATPKFDDGPVCFVCPVKIVQGDTAETLGARVNKAEHEWQALITDKILSGEISWDGKDRSTLIGKIELDIAV